MSDLCKDIDNCYQINSSSFVLKEPGEGRLTNHVHRSIFAATTPVPEQTTHMPSSASPNAGTKLPAQEHVKNDVPEKATGENKLWFLLFLLFALISPNAGTKPPAQEHVKNDVPKETTGENKQLVLLFLLFALMSIVGIVVFCRKRRKSRKPEKKDARKLEQTCPLMSSRSRKLLVLASEYIFWS